MKKLVFIGSSMKERLELYKQVTKDLSLQGLLHWCFETFGYDKIIFASSMGLEDQMLTHLLAQDHTSARVLTLDTGRNFQETYDVMHETMRRFGIRYEVYAPSAHDIETLIQQNGPNLFYDSMQDRKQCCYVRKIKPLQRALSTVDAWMTGLRKQQSVTRTDLDIISWDDQFNIFKINPLLHYTYDQVWDYVKTHNVPYNTLHDHNFFSIGCAPCTRAVKSGEDFRSGRWWWEKPEHKECGLHDHKTKKGGKGDS
ncbi:MAG: phosphoadenylyl-sulfate reductase [bacterium]